MKDYIHARLGPEDRALLGKLKKATGEGESSLVRKGLRLVYQQEVKGVRSALEVAGKSVGKFKGGPKDLSFHKKHLEGFGQ